MNQVNSENILGNGRKPQFGQFLTPGAVKDKNAAHCSSQLYKAYFLIPGLQSAVVLSAHDY